MLNFGGEGQEASSVGGTGLAPARGEEPAVAEPGLGSDLLLGGGAKELL